MTVKSTAHVQNIIRSFDLNEQQSTAHAQNVNR